MVNRAIFLDRDGTLNEEVGYIDQVISFRLFPWAAEAVRMINQAGYKAIVLTNQSGVARGYFTEELVAQVHERLKAELKREGARLDAIYYCPHHPEGIVSAYRRDCQCRKPKPGMVHRAQEEFNLELSECYFIGDKYVDIRLAQSVGAHGILVLTGFGRVEQHDQSLNGGQPPDYIAENLLEAVQWVLRREAGGSLRGR